MASVLRILFSMLGTMQDFPLTLTCLFRHGARIHSHSQVITYLGDRSERATFGEVAIRSEKLARALQRLGIGPGDRVGTFCWNHQQNLEAYLAIPCMGAVNHTLNIRLFPEQLAYIINHAADRVIIVDEALIPVLARVVPELKTVERYIVVGHNDGSLPASLSYEEILAAEQPGFDWPDLDERSAAAMCYTSGTTGNPKGVVYTHRSNFVHTMAACQAGNLGITEQDRLLLIPPMFHANAWGLPYAAWMSGADMIMPGRFSASRTSMPNHRQRAPLGKQRRSDHSQRHPALRGYARRGSLIAAPDELRRLRRAARADRKI